jgi:hypothetical protein
VSGSGRHTGAGAPAQVDDMEAIRAQVASIDEGLERARATVDVSTEEPATAFSADRGAAGWR